MSEITDRERAIIDGIVQISDCSLPDEIELYRLMKLSPSKSHADLAKFIAYEIRHRSPPPPTDRQA